MTVQNDIKIHAKRVAKDVKFGKLSECSREARDFMERVPGAIFEVVKLVQKEANRKTPNEAMIYAYIYLFTSGIEGIRYHIDGGYDWAEELVDAVREQIALMIQNGDMPHELLMLLLNGFIEAKLEPGDELTRSLSDLTLEAAEDEAAPTQADIGVVFDSIVEEAGGNEFEVLAALSEVGKALPPEFREFALHQMSTSDNPVLRDTTVLYLLDAAPEVRRTVCQLIAEHASPSLVSSVALRRMVAVRNWLPKDERPHLDAAVKNARSRNVDCAPWPARQVEEIFVSNIDGAGAQSVFAVTRQARKYVIASLLVKQEFGVADAWCLRDQSKNDVKSFLGEVHSATESRCVGRGFLDTLVSHYLAVGQKAGCVPVAGLLDFLEATGVETWQPAELAADELLALLERDITPARIDQTAVSEVVRRSDGWLDEFGFLESWFEQDAEVDRVLSKKSRAKTSTRVDTVVKSVLEPRRAKWAERFLWTAFWLKQDQDLLEPWVEFFIVGRELQRGRSMTDIPIMRDIAEVTLMVGTMR